MIFKFVFLSISLHFKIMEAEFTANFRTSMRIKLFLSSYNSGKPQRIFVYYVWLKVLVRSVF